MIYYAIYEIMISQSTPESTILMLVFGYPYPDESNYYY